MNNVEFNNFFKKVSKPNGETGCWLWTGTTINGKYGFVWHYDSMRPAHRVIYEHYNGPLPDDMLCCHNCNNKICVNPAHLYAGTPTKNTCDARNDGLLQQAKLTPDAVSAIRTLLKSGMTQAKIASMFNVGIMTISLIKNNKTWKGIV
jgi:hypothetical protein